MQELYELTSPQKTIWLTEQFYKGSSINNVSGTLIIDAQVDFNILKKAINIFVQKNDAMRIHLKFTEDEVMQYIVESTDFEVDLTKIEDEESLKKWENNLAKTPFSMIEVPLCSFKMFKYPNGKGGFNATLHHIISDAWTMGLLIEQIMDNYYNLTNNIDIDLENSYSYIDYINANKEYRNSIKYIKDKEYWNNNFKDEFNVAKIMPNIINKNDTEANRKNIELSTEINNNITEFCNTNKISTFTFLTAVIQIYLSKINKNKTVVIGTPVLNRGNFKDKQTLGMYISTVPFKVNVEETMTFKEFISYLSIEQLSLFRHQKLSYEEIYNIAKENNSITSIYDVMFSYQNTKYIQQKGDIKYCTNWLFCGHISNTIDIHVCDMHNTGEIGFLYDYQINTLTEEEIESIHKSLMFIIDNILNNSDIKIGDIQIQESNKLSTDDEFKIFNDFNNTGSIEINKTVIDIFDEISLEYENNIALKYENNEITYKELRNKMNFIADILRKNGVGRNKPVAMLFHKSIEMIIGMLAIMKSGRLLCSN